MTKESFHDFRGTIFFLEDGVQRIVSLKGAVRALHFHKKSGHYCILTKGSLDYFERPVGDKGEGVKRHIVASHSFYTGPLIEHKMVFSEASEMICVRTGGSMTPEEYENDLVRVKW